MSETTTAAAARTDRPGERPTAWGKPFQPGNPGRPPGIPDKRTTRGAAMARAMEGQAWLVLRELLHHPSWKAREAAAKTILAYAVGLPKATLELTGGLGDLAAELALALAEVRARRGIASSGRPVDAGARLLEGNEASRSISENPRVLEGEAAVISAGVREVGPAADRGAGGNVVGTFGAEAVLAPEFATSTPAAREETSGGSIPEAGGSVGLVPDVEAERQDANGLAAVDDPGEEGA